MPCFHKKLAILFYWNQSDLSKKKKKIKYRCNGILNIERPFEKANIRQQLQILPIANINKVCKYLQRYLCI